jgi:hypothetical protein
MKEKIELRALEIGRLNDETLELSEDDDFWIFDKRILVYLVFQ